jgi:hypothetical protein
MIADKSHAKRFHHELPSAIAAPPINAPPINW